MTAQINDVFRYKGDMYSISSIMNERDFFDIKLLGISPMSTNTANYRGYRAEFGLLKDQLILEALATKKSCGVAEPIAINGVLPEVTEPDVFGHEWHYHEVNLILPYSGTILITSDFIMERYVHMGFQSPLSYRRVIELVFQDGKLSKEADHSETADILRTTTKQETRDELLGRLPIRVKESFAFHLEDAIRWQ